jgi:hypothetical protein
MVTHCCLLFSRWNAAKISKEGNSVNRFQGLSIDRWLIDFVRCVGAQHAAPLLEEIAAVA